MLNPYTAGLSLEELRRAEIAERLAPSAPAPNPATLTAATLLTSSSSSASLLSSSLSSSPPSRASQTGSTSPATQAWSASPESQTWPASPATPVMLSSRRPSSSSQDSPSRSSRADDEASKKKRPSRKGQAIASSACEMCKAKKVKCDAAEGKPCTRCTKRGQAHNCRLDKHKDGRTRESAAYRRRGARVRTLQPTAPDMSMSPDMDMGSTGAGLAVADTAADTFDTADTLDIADTFLTTDTFLATDTSSFDDEYPAGNPAIYPCDAMDESPVESWVDLVDDVNWDEVWAEPGL